MNKKKVKILHNIFRKFGWPLRNDNVSDDEDF